MTRAALAAAITPVDETNYKDDARCPWVAPAGWLLATLFVAMVVCIIFDREALKLLRVLSWVTLVAAAVSDRRMAAARQVLCAVGVWAGAVLAAGAVAVALGEIAPAAYYFVKYQVGVLWLAVAWLAVPVYVGALPAAPGQSAPDGAVPGFLKVLLGLLLLFAFHATLSAAASLFPKDSMELLGSELLPYLGLFIVLLRSAPCMGAGWWQAGARASWGVVAAASLGMGVVMMLALSSRAMADGLFEAGLFRVDSDAPDTRRLQFLFGHHNRAGYFAAIALYLCLAGARGAVAWRWLAMAAAACAALALPFTLTRGALVAAGCGMVIFVIGGLLGQGRGRAQWVVVAALLAAVPLSWVVLPTSYKAHIAKIVNPDNYREHEGGSIGARLVMWETATEMIRARPVLGFGYGYENFESTARLEHPENPAFFQNVSHAHNIWLETAAETGVPGALLLLAFTVMRLAGLVRAWWASARGARPWAWLLLLWFCLELVIQFYGLTNYPLRRNLGLLTYLVWGGSAVLIAWTEPRPMPMPRAVSPPR